MKEHDILTLLFNESVLKGSHNLLKMPDKQIEEFKKSVKALADLEEVHIDNSLVNLIGNNFEFYCEQALHNSPLLSYLREKKKELEPLIQRFNNGESEIPREKELYDFICELLKKFDK
ncbi:MAG: hypothetical protein V1759_00055 [bacterium]